MNFRIKENTGDDAMPYYTKPNEIKNSLDIVTKKKKIEIAFDYPISHTVIFTFTSRNKKGWTRRALYKAIVKGYRMIYRSPVTYGIWGHDMQDLAIECVHRNRIGNKFTLSIGS